MDIQIYVDGSSYSDIDLAEISGQLVSELNAWLENKSAVKLLDDRASDDPEDWKIGLGLKLKSKFKLKDPLNFLYDLAKKHQCEFVVAQYDAGADVSEEVCYFGTEEGKPDLFEIANYLGL